MNNMEKPIQAPTYDAIGVRPLINCRGTYTIISGSVILPQVRQAMYLASQQYVHLEELMDRVGARIAELMQCEWGLATSGCAAALCQITAACVAGSDPANITQLPNTSGMKNRVLVQPSHRHVYEHAVRMVGVEMIEVETVTDLRDAIDDATAMLLIFGDAIEKGQITVRQMADIGREYGIPTFVDAAAERPDVPNWYLEQGVDAVAYSGGKCLRGPQASGLVLGRKPLLETAFLHGAPHHSLGRPMKVGKEEIMGLLAAVEQWVERDHPAEWQEWESWLGLAEDWSRDEIVLNPVRGKFSSEWIQRIKRLATEMHRVLKPGARTVITYTDSRSGTFQPFLNSFLAAGFDIVESTRHIQTAQSTFVQRTSPGAEKKHPLLVLSRN